MESKSEGDEMNNILGTTITWQNVEAKLQKIFHTKACFGDKKDVVRIAFGQGYTCILGRMYLDWMATPKIANLPETLIIKIPNKQTMDELKATGAFNDIIDEQNFQMTKKIFEELAMKMHGNEVLFYKWYKQSGIKALHIPHCYVAEDCIDAQPGGMLILEDIGEDAHVSLPYENINPEDLLQVFDTMTTIQAYSLRTNDWKKIFIAPLQCMKRHQDDIKKILVVSHKSPMLDTETNARMLEEVAKNYDNILDFQLMDNLVEELGMVPVLVHGDLWTNNLLWRKDKSGARQLGGIIDWQNCHPGLAVEDIIRLIVCVLSATVRRNEWRRLLKVYYEMLASKLGHTPPFTLHQLKKSYVKLFPFSGVLCLSVLGPVVDVYMKLNEDKGQDGECVKAIISEKVTGLLEDILEFYNHPETVSLSDEDD